MAQILIIEDEVLLAKSLARSLMGKGHECLIAASAEDGLKMLEQLPADVVLVDLQLPGISGFEAMKKIRQRDPDTAVIVVTAFGTMASAVEAMRSGASDFLRKPLDTEELALAVERALTDARLKQEVAYYHSREVEKTDEDRLITNSSRMREVSEIIDKLLDMSLPSPSEFPPVLILGETGTGKDLIARIIHYRGKLSSKPFVEVNCSSLPKGLEEAELFGHEKGAFTGAHRSKRGLFETAEGGTIFLNEVGDLNLEAQVKLLQAIENKSIRHVGGLRDIDVDVRVIAATNRDLRDKRAFREDLYHRLNNFVLRVPPLRERIEDIVDLAVNFLGRFCRKYGVEKKLSDDANIALTEYNWPGNVRELRQLIERVIFLTGGSTIGAIDLNIPQSEKSTFSLSNDGKIRVDFPEEGIDFESIEKEVILQALISSGGNVSEAARKLKIGREALRYRITKHSISKLTKIIG
ncbi:MAG: sigma-54 dependent transcriptional regulator [candidate division Zixibacteria bacterium]